MKGRLLAVFSFLLALAIGGWADTLTLKNGRQVSGRLVAASPRDITFEEDNGPTRHFNVADLSRIDFDTFNQNQSSRNRSDVDFFGNDRHAVYDRYRDRPDYRDRQPDGGAIEAKQRDMASAGLALGQPQSAERTSSDGVGRFRVFQNATVYWSPRTGAHEVHGAIRDQYVNMGGETGRLGYPVTDEMPAQDGVGRVSNFERGSIYWSPETGARVNYR